MESTIWIVPGIWYAIYRFIYLKNAETFDCCICFPLCDALRNSVAFEQFKKREKHPWRSATLNEVAVLRVFFRCFKLYKWYQSRKASHMI